MENGEWNGVLGGIGSSFSAKIHPLFKAKTKKLSRKTTAAKENEAAGHGQRCTAVPPNTTGHGAPHRQPVVAPAWPGLDTSRTLRFGVLLAHEFLPWIIRIGHIELLFLTSLIF